MRGLGSGLRLPYTTAEVAAMVGRSKTFILDEIRSGRLHARHKKGQVKYWYMTEEDVREWLEKGMWE